MTWDAGGHSEPALRPTHPYGLPPPGFRRKQ